MRISFACPSDPSPVGGVIALYQLANALHRRGHLVQLLHLPLWDRSVSGPEDLVGFGIEPGVAQHFAAGGDVADALETDVVFGTGAPERLGLPVLLVQGFEILHPWLERSAFRSPSLKVCVASWLVDVGRHFGVPAEQMRVVPCGIDHDRYRVSVALEDRPPRVGVLHHHLPAKGWATALEALARARVARPDLEVVAFGARPPEAPLPDWVTFVLRPEPEVLANEVYNRCRAFVQASDHEGFGLTAVEAMACGAAVVTTDNGGSRDYAFDGVTALVAPPGDVDGLAARLVEVLGDDGLRRHLVGNGLRQVEVFDWDRSAGLMEGHLSAYLADPGAHRRPPGPEQPLDRLPPPPSALALSLVPRVPGLDARPVSG